MPDKAQCAAAIFAGGTSHRMGRNKALLPWRGKTLLAYLAGELDDFPEKLLSADGLALPAEDWAQVSDLMPGCGPLGALQSVLTRMRSEMVLCVACDLPFFTRELAQQMCAAFRPEADCLVCRDETGHVHPVCAIYRKKMLPLVCAQIRSGKYRMMDLLARAQQQTFQVSSSQMLNANTPEIWKRACGICDGTEH